MVVGNLLEKLCLSTIFRAAAYTDSGDGGEGRGRFDMDYADNGSPAQFRLRLSTTALSIDINFFLCDHGRMDREDLIEARGRLEAFLKPLLPLLGRAERRLLSKKRQVLRIIYAKEFRVFLGNFFST